MIVQALRPTLVCLRQGQQLLEALELRPHRARQPLRLRNITKQLKAISMGARSARCRDRAKQRMPILLIVTEN
ncbi:MULTISPECIES: hypothetical protein [Sulfitobacter]|uniref:Uncharacterized protein n=1 Tax=Sulfitobacter profundi TaxID=2679961 RepID=A0ABW1Z0R3_9RHOB|nr:MULTISPECIES: hypothetical protein [Sulfitobacter]UWR36364.1 hypothetical protein K3762_11170 [Sulfitobacter sp. W074]